MRKSIACFLGLIAWLCVCTFSNQCTNFIELTSAQNRHKSFIVSLKMTQDQKKLFSLDFNGTLKVWNIDINQSKMILRQQIQFREEEIFSTESSLNVWNNGQRIFVGAWSNHYLQMFVRVYNYSKSADLYDFKKPQQILVNDSIQAIQVNRQGNRIFVGTFASGIHLFTYKNNKWVLDTPLQLKKNIVNMVKWIKLAKNQQILHVLYQNFSTRPQAEILRIFRLNESLKYQVNQTINRGGYQYGSTTCGLSTDQKFINCNGVGRKFQNYMYDEDKKQFVNVSIKSPINQSNQGSFMDINQVFTLITSQYSNMKENFYPYSQHYKFSYENGVPQYTFINMYQTYKNGMTSTLFSDKQSKFQIVATTDQQNDTYFGIISINHCSFENSKNLLEKNLKLQEE